MTAGRPPRRSRPLRSKGLQTSSVSTSPARSVLAGLACLSNRQAYVAKLIGVVALSLLAALPARASQTVRISLFSLFKPHSLEIRIASGEGRLEAAGTSSGDRVLHGESIRIRASGGRLSVARGSVSTARQQQLTVSAVRIVPAGSSTIELIVPGRIRRVVRGIVEVDCDAGARGGLRIVLTSGREEAVASVVAAETSARSVEGLKALAVIVRTFMISHSGRHSNEGFDFCDTTHCQLYRGEQDLSERSSSRAVIRAVAATAGEFLSFEGAPIEGYYTGACGGISATPSSVWGGSERYPYKQVKCAWCRNSKFARWERSARATFVLDALSLAAGIRLSDAAVLNTEADQSSGLVRSVSVTDGDNRTVLSADAFRRAIGVRLGWNTVLSPTFTVERRGVKFIFRGRGFGSQVGLCEAGAFAQAVTGRGYRDILKYYYPHAEVGELAHD